ncbi:heme/copper-type cytochrome/quinol oxidase subunit 3 [Blastococcus colisei]|uniref:cytochrome-c oxidase n=1 Tax=Blastococcus colisei TaxID=1564162 RepID=A0A543PES1_9ACTN|nr:cytochrome c oxidase subunit 3 [Blastococcus colisei]TQN42556.1 heme/copper-type cytochrome/quinol oxidase subunit 3 [Blastococcus colisei]
MRTSGYAGDPAPRPAPAIARDSGWWGMQLTLWVLISMLAALLFSYYYLRTGASTWPPPPAEDPVLWRTGIATGLLVLSVVPAAVVHVAARSGRAGGRLPAALAVALVIGAAFLAIQLADYPANGIDPQRDVYGSLVLALAGFHHINAVLVLIGFAVVALKVRGDRMQPRDQQMAVTVAYYWYFVVGSWLVIAFTLYLTPRFW